MVVPVLKRWERWGIQSLHTNALDEAIALPTDFRHVSEIHRYTSGRNQHLQSG